VSDPKKPPQLPASVSETLSRGKAALARLSRPARILIATTLAMTALSVAYVAYQQTHEPYAVLFTQLDQDDAAAIVASLKEQKTPYLIGAGGSTIEVPESRVGEARLALASSGMPRGGGVGFESFDKMRLGATEFEQRVLYRRALEGELARTIGTLGSVQAARVHLVLPEKSVFVSRSDPASASIVLKLRSGRSVGPSEVSGIVHLLAASVPGLTADHVAVVSTDGEMLKKPRSGESVAGAASDEEEGALAHTIESQLEDRTRSMLEKIVGAGHVDVRVTADVDSASVEHTEDHYDPARTALRSEETSLERGGSAVDDAVAGVPGAESNLPGGGAPALPPSAAAAIAGVKGGDGGAPKAIAAASKATEPVRESHTRNFEVDHVSDKRVTRGGTLKRITAAVVLDGVTKMVDGSKVVVARDRQELDRLATLARSALGVNEARGDVVTVDSVPFQDSASANEAPALAAPPSPILSRNWRVYAPVGGGAAVLLAVSASAFAIARRRRRAKAAATAIELSSATPAVELPAAPTTSPEALRAAAFERAAKDPATAAIVVRFWLGTRDAQDSKSLTP
jgi:flagellar M-ring protein FliF